MTNKEYVMQTMKRYGKVTAEDLQARSADMTGTQLYAEEEYIPDFKAVFSTRNMLERKAGFVCKSTAGRVVKLLQPYDSDVYTQEPEELSAQWGFKWSTDPAKALPFISLSTSPFMKGDCCTYDGLTFRSKIDNNVWSPEELPAQWEEVPANDE